MEFLYIKVFHILSIITWMAMLFYLPRLFVYHKENLDNQGFCSVVEIQEKKLFHFIGVPALVCTLLSGFWLLHLEPSFLKSGGWLHAKLLLVFFLVLYHGSLYYFMLKLQNKTCAKSGMFFRIYNEVPTLILIFITFLVVIKPF